MDGGNGVSSCLVLAVRGVGRTTVPASSVGPARTRSRYVLEMENEDHPPLPERVTGDPSRVLNSKAKSKTAASGGPQSPPSSIGASGTMWPLLWRWPVQGV